MPKMIDCDVCGYPMPCVRLCGYVAGIETYACHKCRDWDDEDCDECADLDFSRFVNEFGGS